MDCSFKQAQNALNSIQRRVKQHLQDIQILDKKCIQLDLHLQNMRQEYLQELTKDSISLQSLQRANKQDLLEIIAKLQEQQKILGMQKIKLAEEIQKVVLQTCQKIDNQIILTASESFQKSNLKEEIKNQHMFMSGLKKQKGRQKNVHPEIKSIIKQYFNEKSSEQTVFQTVQKYCLCNEDKKLLFPGSMIECQNLNCKIGWYHFQCVGINFDFIPSQWYCKNCINEIKKDLKKVEFNFQNQKVEYQFQPQKEKIVQQVKLEKTGKKGRGRPKNIVN